MKKSLVLAMAMALGVTASAYAANPFSDVPAGHWAYDSVNKLAAAGVVDGYPDGTYGGDKLMTRYEMAQIVAKAMAKGANVDKLAAEFADELDSLGVRVANLEKKADNVKITGEVRFRSVSQEGANYKDGWWTVGNGSNHVADIRSRIWVNGAINDDWSYTGMLENVQDLTDDVGNEDTSFQRAYVEGKLGGLKVTAGRYNLFLADGNIYDTRADGVEVSYGSKIKVTGFAGKAADGISLAPISFKDNNSDDKFTLDDPDNSNGGTYAGFSVSADIAKGLNLAAGYVNFKDIASGADTGRYEDHDLPDFVNHVGGGVIGDGLDNGIWHAGLTYNVGDVTFSGMYLKGDMSWDENKAVNKLIEDHSDDHGVVFGVNYKGAEADQAGSWGIWAKYYDQGAQTYVAHTTDANTFGMTGFKGYGVGANYTFAKNIVGTVAYYDTESKLADKLDKDYDDQRLWADVTFTF